MIETDTSGIPDYYSAADNFQEIMPFLNDPRTSPCLHRLHLLPHLLSHPLTALSSSVGDWLKAMGDDDLNTKFGGDWAGLSKDVVGKDSGLGVEECASNGIHSRQRQICTRIRGSPK
jgi:hypothetical protein